MQAEPETAWRSPLSSWFRMAFRPEPRAPRQAVTGQCYLPHAWTGSSASGAKRKTTSGQTTCATCGAPLDARNLVSDSGWREAPRLRDMTEFRFSNSSCQVEGELVPVAEINLAPGDSVFFEHHVLLWKDEIHAPVGHGHGGGLKRMLGGMPHIISVAHGPGRVAFCRDASGEIVVLPLHPSMELDVREHAFLVASHSITYSFERIKGMTNVLHGEGMYMDRFVTSGRAGDPAAARLRQRVRAHAGAGREDPGGAGRLPLQGLLGGDEHGAAEHKDRAYAPRDVPGRDDRARAGSGSSPCTSTTTAAERGGPPPMTTTADRHLHLPLLPAAQRRQRRLLPPLRGAGRRLGRGQRRPAGRSSLPSGTWPASSSASPPVRSRAPTCRAPTSNWPATTGSTSRTTTCCGPSRPCRCNPCHGRRLEPDAGRDCPW